MRLDLSSSPRMKSYSKAPFIVYIVDQQKIRSQANREFVVNVIQRHNSMVNATFLEVAASAGQ